VAIENGNRQGVIDVIKAAKENGINVWNDPQDPEATKDDDEWWLRMHPAMKSTFFIVF
jgi:sugar/nucleoside kinase (ribokinase family)